MARNRQDRVMPTTLRKILWFVALWCAGVATVGAVAYAIRAMIG